MPIEVTTTIRLAEAVRAVVCAAANEPAAKLSIFYAERLEAAAREIRERVAQIKEVPHAR